ncbi:hypothetical protein ACA910_016685 [Epithemia clementina (nom. ined.)]
MTWLCSLYFALVSSSTSAFSTQRASLCFQEPTLHQQQRSPAAVDTGRVHTTTTGLYVSPPDSQVGDVLETAEPQSYTTDESGPYNVRRRQIIVSMLSMASLSPLLKASLADDAEEDINPPSPQLPPVNIVKPPLDDRDYFTFTLDNGLRVLLCSDPSTNEAAVAMDVHVGATSDPVEVPGLAHFTEHMLFLGTKQYPQENSFEAFLSNHGGSSNAYTDSENTVYYFDMEAEAASKLMEGLSRFGSFFSDPLFAESATGRELNAIESENKKNLQTDSFRLYQMTKSRANSEHPFSKFFTGNRLTLLDNTVAQGIDLREQLIRFYKTHYSANQMTLAVVAPQSIDELKVMVEETFASIPNSNVEKPENSWAGVLPFGMDKNSIIPSFGNILEIVPVQDLRQLMIAWPIVYKSPKELEEARLYKTSTYVAHLLGHEGPKSLLSYLKRKGWVNTVAVGAQEELSDFETFDLVVGLTSQGLDALDDIVEAIYSYIMMIRDRQVPTYVVNEVLQLEELQWRFTTKGSPRNYATALATSMQKYPPEYYVAGPRRLALDGVENGIIVDATPRSGFVDKDQLARTVARIDKLVRNMVVENGMITVLSKSFENLTDRKERWYGTDYRTSPIASSVLDKWTHPVSTKSLQINFPRPNIFIPSEAGLRVKFPPLPKIMAAERTFESRLTPIRPPRILQDDDKWTVYFKEDDRFGVPKAYVVLEISSKYPFESSKNAAIANLYEVCVTDRLGEYAYDAGLAGLTYEVKVVPRGLRFTFGGYNDKLKDFVEYVTRKLSKDVRQLLPQNDAEFGRYKDQVMRALTAFDVKQPYFHASYYSQLVIQPRRFLYPNSDLRVETRSILLPDLVEYAESVLKFGRGEALIQGNLDEQEALSLAKMLDKILPFQSIPSSLLPPRQEALPLPPSRGDVVPTRLLITEPNPADENSVSYILLQSLGKSERDHVLIELISAIVSEPFYNELRTRRQLGYIVSSGLRGLAGTRTLSFVVQSSVAASAFLTVEIIKFLDTVDSNILQKLSDADIAVYIRSLIDRKTEPDKDLSVEVTRNWSEIASGRLEFDRLQKEAAELLEVQKEDLIDFWRQLYSNDGRRALITEMIPRQGEASSILPPTSSGYEAGDIFTSGLVLGIDDITQFRRDSEKLFLLEQSLLESGQQSASEPEPAEQAS